MLSAVGCSHSVARNTSTDTSNHNPCCDVCDPSVCSAHIVCLQPVLSSARRPKRRRVRVASPEDSTNLEEKLRKVRDDIILKHPGFQMLGGEFVLSSSVIKAMCKDVQFIDSVEYIKERFGVRPELCDELFSVIESVFLLLHRLVKGYTNFYSFYVL